MKRLKSGTNLLDPVTYARELRDAARSKNPSHAKRDLLRAKQIQADAARRRRNIF